MEQSLPNTPISPNKLSRSSTVVIIIALIVFLSVVLFYYNQKIKPGIQPPVKTEQPTATSSAFIKDPKKAVAKVGEEIIYQQDLDVEIAKQPNFPSTPSAKTQLLQKIASDSAILQGAAQEGLVTLDKTVFNSTEKDYLKRIKLVEELKSKVTGQADSISGTIIAIWFHNIKIGPLGLEKSKQMAYDKITKLQSEVKTGKITIEQAGEAIKKDTSLAQIDPAYASNALLNFKINRGQQLTGDKKFNDALSSLKVNEISDVFLGQDRNSVGKTFDALYHFGQIKQRIESGKPSFTDWFALKAKKYALTIY